MDGLITEPPTIGSTTTVPRWNTHFVSSPRNPRANLDSATRIKTPTPMSPRVRTFGDTHNTTIRTPANLGSEVKIDLSPLKIPPITLTPTPVHAPTPVPTPVPTHVPKQSVPKPSVPKPAPKPEGWVRPSQRPIPDYSSMSEIDKVKQWAIIEDRFNTLKQGLPPGYEISFPDPNTDTLEQAHARYNQCVENYLKNQFISDEADKYRFYLLCMWAVMEIVLLLFGVTSANGFTNMQYMMISKYDMTLLMLGEQKWDQIGGATSSSPIYDIVSSSVIMMCIFLGLKLITSALGEELSCKATNYMVGKMVERYKGKSGSDGLIGVGDIFGLISDLRTAASKPGGLSVDNVLGMFGNIVSGGAEIFT